MSSAMSVAVAHSLMVKLPASRPTHHLLGDDTASNALPMSHHASMAAMSFVRPQPRPISLGLKLPRASAPSTYMVPSSPIAPSVALRRAWLQHDDACSFDHSQDASVMLTGSPEPQSPAPEIVDMHVDVSVAYKPKELRAVDSPAVPDAPTGTISPAEKPPAPQLEEREEQQASPPSAQPSGADATAQQQQQAQPDDPSSLFMRLFAEHGGVPSISKPPPFTSELRNRTRDPLDGCTLDTWQSACHRAQAHAASASHRSVLRAAGRFPPTGADLPDDDGFGPSVWRPTAHILGDAASASFASSSKRGRFMELPKSYQPRISLTPHGHSRLAGAKAGPSQPHTASGASAWRKSVPSGGAASARVASVLDRLQSHSQSPRALKTPRTYDATYGLLRTDSQQELASLPWAAKACAMCGVAEPAIGGQCCECAHSPFLLRV